MKYILLYYIFLFLPFTSYCQLTDTGSRLPSLPLIDNRIVYTGTIEMDTSISTAALFQNIEKWYAHTLETSDNTLTIDNRDDGKISGTGIISDKRKHKQHDEDEGDIFFTIDIVSKKGRYDYKVYGMYGMDKTGKFYYSDIYNEELYPIDKPKWTKQYREQRLSYMNGRMLQMIAEMQEYLLQKG